MAITKTWNAAFEASPAGTDNISQGDDKIREDKVAVRERAEREHIWGTSETNANHGWHREGSAMAYVDASEPTNRPDGATGLTAAIDEGRLWIDTDGGATPFYYTSGGAWAKCFSSITDDGTDVTFGNDVIATNDITATGSVNADTFLIGPKEVHGSIHAAGTVLQSTVWDALSPDIPDDDDTIIVTGGFKAGSGGGDTYVVSKAIRTNSTTITLYVWSRAASNAATFTITDSGSTVSAAGVSIAW